jgi:pSer/pThr/pTyr-binding forkhead associated (FHA) protein
MGISRAPFGPHAASPAELQAQLAADRRGQPYLLLRDGHGRQRILPLDDEWKRATIGRDFACDVALGWDGGVSRIHAELNRLGDDWTIIDDDLSRNGTFVNGERLRGRHRLRDGDLILCGSTELAFRSPGDQYSQTLPAQALAPKVQLSEAQRRVLVALCRPYAAGPAMATPATNQQIADELVLSVEAVKTHMRTLFQKFQVEDLPHNRKRARLVELALQSGAVTPRELAR